MTYDPADYAVNVRKLSVEEGGGFVATVADLPGCMADGETMQEAVDQVQDAITSYVRTLEEMGEAVPAPGKAEQFSGKFNVRIPSFLHALLVERARSDGISLNLLVATYLAERAGAKTGR